MLSLAPSEVLDVCDRGHARAPVERAVLLLGAAWTGRTEDEVSRLPIGVRNGHLLRLRKRLFGATLAVDTSCPSCGERLETELGVAELLAEAPLEEPPGPIEVEVDGWAVAVRCPTSLDVAGVTSADELFQRCLVPAGDGETLSVADLPEALVAAAAEAMAEADPLADVELGMDCPSCQHTWGEPMDLAAFVWAEVEAAAPQILYDVHRFAVAYGWTEREVLALSPWRRAHYLSLLDA